VDSPAINRKVIAGHAILGSVIEAKFKSGGNKMADIINKSMKVQAG
jgi:hypothetical protein